MTARKGLARDGNNPTMVYGYGGFSVSMLPAYRPDVPAWLEKPGVLVHLYGKTEARPGRKMGHITQILG